MRINFDYVRDFTLGFFMGWEGYPLLIKILFQGFMQKRRLILEEYSREQDSPIGNTSRSHKPAALVPIVFKNYSLRNKGI